MELQNHWYTVHSICFYNIDNTANFYLPHHYVNIHQMIMKRNAHPSCYSYFTSDGIIFILWFQIIIKYFKNEEWLIKGIWDKARAQQLRDIARLFLSSDWDYTSSGARKTAWTKTASQIVLGYGNLWRWFCLFVLWSGITSDISLDFVIVKKDDYYINYWTVGTEDDLNVMWNFLLLVMWHMD